MANSLNSLDPAAHLIGGREFANQLLCFIDICHFLMQVFSVTLCEFGDCVDTGRFQQFCIFFAHPFDPRQIGLVYPAQDHLLADCCLLGYRFASLWRGALLEQRISGRDSCPFQFLCIGRADSFDLCDLGHVSTSF
jgi:hypothetical protein